jgi:hypothetical protein
MTDNGNQPRPARTLTVKNFSVIKEAKLEFGKITVLIGPQSSGKSLLCKLAHFFGQVVPEIENNALGRRKSFDEFRETLYQAFIAYFPYSAWRGQDFQIRYESSQFDVGIEQRDESSPFVVLFDSEFSQRYSRFIEPAPDGNRRQNVVAQGWVDERVQDGPLRIEDSTYIPTGRSFYSITNKAFSALSTKNLDWITQRYAQEFDADYNALRESYFSRDPVLHEFGELATAILKGRVDYDEGRLVFEQTADNRRLPFDLLSSGTLELLPLMNTLSQLAQKARFPDIPTTPSPRRGTIYVEEPELGVFPSTQNDLVRLFSWLAGENNLVKSYAITTHSPYILSAFNNLVEASQVVAAKPELKEEVAKLIPERYWVKSGDFKAYCIHDGNLESIMDKETGLASANYLDSVSETIGVEFDELLRLGYVES